MCTYGFVKTRDKILVFKNRDNDYEHVNERFETNVVDGVRQLALRDDKGKYEEFDGIFLPLTEINHFRYYYRY